MQTRALATLLALPMILLAASAPGQVPASPPEWWYWRHYGDFGWGQMVFGTLLMIVFWGGLILAILLAVRWFGRGSSGTRERRPGTGSALHILQQRFARGEIDKTEFDGCKRLLSERDRRRGVTIWTLCSILPSGPA